MMKGVEKHLVCPVTKSSLELRPEEVIGTEVIKGELVSVEGKVYEIIKGVPHFLESQVEASKIQTEGSFSDKWNKTPDYGIDGEMRSFHCNWFIERYGFKDEQDFKNHLQGKKLMLDAGAGAGRNALWFAELAPHAQVFAVDISESVHHAKEHTSHLDNVCVVRGDITDLPFPDGLFDFIVCDQVIHHTPEPEKTFAHLVSLLKPGGEISCYVYKKKSPVREFCDDYIRQHTTEMTEEECVEFCKAITELGKSLTEQKIEFEIPVDIPLLGFKAGKHDLQRFFYWFIVKCFWNESLGYDNSLLTNVDWYHPEDAFRYTPEEFRKWYADNDLEIIAEDIQHSGISLRAIKR
jgi:ubiquinone/menaquinone biosynthesis C-methylase UbiE/uncharacterized protein YbaR (Trm112 family)